MIPEEQKDEIISAGISFMRSITNVYGSDIGLKLWEKIADSVDEDLKREIFIAMLTGEFNGNKLILTCPYTGSVHNKISIIKAIRTYDSRRLGLKEAKDLAEILESGKKITLEVDYKLQPTARVEFRKLGLVV
jgi:hypothetical protein